MVEEEEEEKEKEEKEEEKEEEEVLPVEGKHDIVVFTTIIVVKFICKLDKNV